MTDLSQNPDYFELLEEMKIKLHNAQVDQNDPLITLTREELEIPGLWQIAKTGQNGKNRQQIK